MFYCDFTMEWIFQNITEIKFSTLLDVHLKVTALEMPCNDQFVHFPLVIFCWQFENRLKSVQFVLQESYFCNHRSYNSCTNSSFCSSKNKLYFFKGRSSSDSFLYSTISEVLFTLVLGSRISLEECSRFFYARFIIFFITLLWNFKEAFY